MDVTSNFGGDMDDQTTATSQPQEAVVAEQQEVPAAPVVASSDDLDTVKKDALQALVPVLDELKNISAERKFDICMNAMRFTDDKALARKALEAAQQIEEPGTKAEALVELVNEINYLEQA